MSEQHADRRTGGDRRAHGDGERGRRGAAAPTGAKRATTAVQYAVRTLGAIVLLLGIIVFAVRSTRPVFATRGTVAAELRKHAPVAAAVLAPEDSSTMDKVLASPKYAADRRAFYEDLMRTKRIDSARADSIAQYAVREAYIRGVSPAIIFGVMLTENARFISRATSNVGAVGLMQVYPKVWGKKQFTDSLGTDLAEDSTNVRFGVFILSHYFNPRDKFGNTRERDYRTALLRYNGCVKGTNTPHCKNYPDKVKTFVEGQALSICSGKGFYECIAKPFIAGLMGDTPNKTETSAGEVDTK